LGDLLGLKEDIERIRMSRNGRDLEIIFAPADMVAGRGRGGREGGREEGREGGREGGGGKEGGITKRNEKQTKIYLTSLPPSLHSSLPPSLADEADSPSTPSSRSRVSALASSSAAASSSLLSFLPPLDLTKHGLNDIHFAVKALLNAKTGR